MVSSQGMPGAPWTKIIMYSNKVSVKKLPLVWFHWGLTPQQQPGSYQGDDDDISFLMEETRVPGGNHRPTASNSSVFILICFTDEGHMIQWAHLFGQ